MPTWSVVAWKYLWFLLAAVYTGFLCWHSCDQTGSSTFQQKPPGGWLSLQSPESLRLSDFIWNPKSHRLRQREFLGKLLWASFTFGSSDVSTCQESESPHISEQWAFNTYSKDLIPDLVRIVNLLKSIRLLDSDITCRVWNELSFKPSV